VRIITTGYIERLYIACGILCEESVKMYQPKAARPKSSTAPLRDSVNILFDLAIDQMNREEKEQGRKLAFIMRKQDAELKAQQLWDKYNTCPHCHLVLTTSGYCDNCDYVKPRGICKSCAYNQEGICLNRKGCEGQEHTIEHDIDRCDNWVKL
jgi:hypothetical protein